MLVKKKGDWFALRHRVPALDVLHPGMAGEIPSLGRSYLVGRSELATLSAASWATPEY
jgi:hypothetical protein